MEKNTLKMVNKLSEYLSNHSHNKNTNSHWRNRLNIVMSKIISGEDEQENLKILIEIFGGVRMESLCEIFDIKWNDSDFKTILKVLEGGIIYTKPNTLRTEFFK